MSGWVLRGRTWVDGAPRACGRRDLCARHRPPTQPTHPPAQIYETDSAAAAGLADLVAQASREAVAARGAFTLALSGGSLIRALNGLVGRADVDFSKW